MKEVIAYIHTHWDREWYREFEEFRLRLVEVFDEILNALETGKIPCFYFDGQICALEDYLEIRPEKELLIKFLIREKKLFIGPFFCSTDSLLVSGSSLFRNLKYGIEKSKDYGCFDFIGYIADSFGHSKDIPLLLNYFKITKACLWRGLGDLPADIKWGEVRVVNLIQGYFQDFLNSDLPIEKKAENLKKYLDKISQESDKAILLPIGADHLCIAKDIKDTIYGLNKIYKDYKITIASPFDYFYRVYKSKKYEGEFLENNRTFLLKGVYSSRPYVKRANALSQWSLTRIAEPLNLIMSKFLNVKNMQSEINYAYKELLKNQAHDSIYGCCIDEVIDDIMVRYKNVNTIANGVIKRTLRDISDENGDLTLINLSNFDYSGKVFVETEKELPEEFNAIKISSRKGFTDKKLYDINDIPITEDITTINTYLIDVKNLKPFSLTKITKEYIEIEHSIQTGKSYIENKFIKIEVKNNKLIVTDKQKNEIYKDFISIKDYADIGDSYNFGPLKGDKPINALMKTYKIKEKNSIRAILQVIYEVEIPLSSDTDGRIKVTDKCKINIEFTLYNQSKIAEIKAYWINKSKNHILKFGFNLKDKIKTTVSEDLYSTVEREFNPDYIIYKHIPAKKGIELKTNTAPMQRFVNAHNLTVFTKGISEYEVSKNTLNITLLRAMGIISNPDNPSRGTPAGPPLETPCLQCIGDNTADFSFSFTKDTDNMYKLAEEYYNPCLSLFSKQEDKIFFIPRGIIYSIFAEKKSLYGLSSIKSELRNIVIKH